MDEVRQSMADNEEAARTLSAVVNQLDANQVDLAQFPLTLGPALEFDPKSEQFMGPGAADANRLLRNEMRKEYAIPEVV